MGNAHRAGDFHLTGILSELKRRNVIRMAGLYLVGAWLLTQVAATLLPVFEAPGWVMKTLVGILAVGFIPAMIFAWVFELTPDGLKRDADVVPSESIAPQTAQRMNRLIAALLVLAVVYFGVDKFVLAPKREASLVETTSKTVAAKTVASIDAQNNKINPRSIAVLPFEDLSPGKDQEYFSDGMAEEILNVLAKVDSLNVASRTSSFQFKGREVGIPEIAKQLKVRHILEGSVRKAGSTVRITAQLIDTQTDRHLWSETFDRPLTTTNIFTIQDEIANAIVKALGQSMAATADAKISVAAITDNLSAYELFLQARPMFAARYDLDKADALLTRAVEQDPNFANAWEMRAALQFLMVDYGYSSAKLVEVEQQALEFANRALAINPNSATAIASIAQLKRNAADELRARGDYSAIIAAYKRALAIDPKNTSAMNWLGNTYRSLGDMNSALAMYSRCAQIDPFYVPCLGNQMNALSDLSRDAEALAVYYRALDAGMPNISANLGLLAKHGLENEFKLQTGSADMLFGWRRHGELYEAYRHPEKNHQELIADIRSFNQKSGNLLDDNLATLLVPIGANDRMGESIIMWDPTLSRYRQTAAFKTQIRGSGVLDYWHKHGFPPQCKPVGNDDFECK